MNRDSCSPLRNIGRPPFQRSLLGHNIVKLSTSHYTGVVAKESRSWLSTTEMNNLSHLFQRCLVWIHSLWIYWLAPLICGFGTCRFDLPQVPTHFWRASLKLLEWLEVSSGGVLRHWEAVYELCMPQKAPLRSTSGLMPEGSPSPWISISAGSASLPGIVPLRILRDTWPYMRNWNQTLSKPKRRTKTKVGRPVEKVKILVPNERLLGKE